MRKIRKAAVADRIDVDDRRVAAGVGDDVVIAHHHFGIGVRNAEGVHHLLAGLLLAVEDDRHDRLHPVREARIGGAHQLFVVLDEIDVGLDQLAHHFGGLVRTQARAPA